MSGPKRDVVQQDATEVEPADWFVTECDVPDDEKSTMVSGEHVFVSFWRKSGDRSPGRVKQSFTLRMDEDDVRGQWPKAGGKTVPSNKWDSKAWLYYEANRDAIQAEIKQANLDLRAGKREVFVVGKES